MPDTNVNFAAIEENKQLIKFLHDTLSQCKKELSSLRGKLGITYWVIIGLSVIMFIVGIALILIPFIMSAKGLISPTDTITPSTIGIVDIITLFLFKPIERIHRQMGDMSQITFAINTYQEQVALILLKIDSTDRTSLETARQDIEKASQNSIVMIQKYYEEKDL